MSSRDLHVDVTFAGRGNGCLHRRLSQHGQQLRAVVHQLCQQTQQNQIQRVVCDRSSLEVNKYYQETMKRKLSHVIKLARKNKNTISKT